MHISRPLQNLTIAAMSDAKDFHLFDVAPALEVDAQIDKYFEYDTGAWNRIEMSPRGSSEQSARSGWDLSTSEYNCQREAVAKETDWSDAAQADAAINTDQDAADYLANQARMRGEQLMAANMVAGTWTQDWDGAAAKAYGSSQVLYWDNASGDPQADHYYISGLVKAQVGKWPNVMMVGQSVHSALVGNAQVRDALKHTGYAGGKDLESKMAEYFGVEKYLVGGAFYNSAKEGQTKSLAQIFPTDSVWAGYVNPRVGKKVMTAMTTFCFKDGGRASQGVVARQWDDTNITSTISEIETFWDVKIISADAGYFIDDVLT
jgi:hypothetical protein